MKDQRVNFIVGNITVVGGVEKVTQILSNEFITRGAYVTIHSLYSQNADYPVWPGIKIQHFALNPPDLEKNLISKIKRLVLNGLILRGKLAGENGFVIFQGFYLAAYLPLLKIHRGKSIVCEHNTYDAVGKVSKFIRRLIYRSSRPNLIVLTDSDMSHYAAAGVKNISKIYNPSPYPRQVSSNNPKAKVIFSIGRFTHQKRFDLMIEICAPLFSIFPDWSLKIQGSGDDLEKMKSTISKLHLEKNVVILPPGDPTPLYEEGSIFLMTSLFEGLPMTLIEAMTFGTPVVVYNCSPGLAEIVNDGMNGYLVPMNDSQSMIDKVRRLIENASLREEIGSYAKTFSQHFDTDRVLKEWEKIIR